VKPPSLLKGEVAALKEKEKTKPPLVILDEVQKVNRLDLKSLRDWFSWGQFSKACPP